MATRAVSSMSFARPAPIEFGIANRIQDAWGMPYSSVLMSPARPMPSPPTYYGSPFLVVPTARAPGSRIPSLSSTATSGSARSGFDSRPQTPMNELVEADMRPIPPALAHSLLMAPRVRFVELPPLATDGSAVDEADGYEGGNIPMGRSRVEDWQRGASKTGSSPLYTAEIRYRYQSRA